jgi:VanZ family protein
MTGIHRKTGRRFVLGAYVAALLVLMLMPVPPTPSYLPVYFDKIVHVGLFFALAALAYWSNVGEQRPSVIRIVVACAALAAVIEVVQSQLGYRTGDPKDFLAGTLGALIGAIAARFVLGGARR